jgi:D-arginine dehydrogenase
MLEAGGYLSARGAIHLARAGEQIELVEGSIAEPLQRPALEALLPGLREPWQHGLQEESLADIDVARLHGDLLASACRSGAVIATDAGLKEARQKRKGWTVRLGDGTELTAALMVDAAGAWADGVAEIAGVAPLGLTPKRRTMVQLRVSRSGLKRLPLVIGADGSFYFKGEGTSPLPLNASARSSTGRSRPWSDAGPGCAPSRPIVCQR